MKLGKQRTKKGKKDPTDANNLDFDLPSNDLTFRDDLSYLADSVPLLSDSKGDFTTSAKGDRVADNQSLPWTKRLWNLLLKAFDWSTIAISMIDICSDVIVAWQFYSEGHMLWFWLVMASLLVSNCCYTFFFIEEYWRCSNRYFGTRSLDYPRYATYPAVFLIGQLIPTIVWYAETGDQEEKRKTNTNSEHQPLSRSRRRRREPGTQSQQNGGTLADQELEEIAKETAVIDKMQSTMQDHIKSHALFYVETVVESIPQSIVQLLAVTFLGEATNMQLFSMSLSLCSIVSKAYLVAQSSDLRVFAFKFFCAAHDVFSLFYVFSTVISAERAHEAVLPFIGTPVTFLSALWAKKLLFEVTLLTLFAFCTFVTIIYLAMKRGRLSGREKRDFCGVFVAAVGLYLPAVFVVEGSKLLIAVFFLFALEPAKTNGFCFSRNLRAFVEHGESWAEQKRRIHHLMLSWSKLEERRRRECLESYQSRYTYSTPSKWEIDYHIKAKGILELCDVPEEDYNTFAVFWKYRVDFSAALSGFKSAKFRIQVLIVSIFTLLIVCTIGAIFSIAFPFLNWLLHGHQHNAFQSFCFGAVVLCWLCMLPFMYSTAKFAFYSAALSEVLQCYDTSLDEAKRWITDYHKPTARQILQAVTPRELLPYDIAYHMGKFLPDERIVLGTLTLEDCKNLKKEE